MKIDTSYYVFILLLLSSAAGAGNGNVPEAKCHPKMDSILSKLVYMAEAGKSAKELTTVAEKNGARCREQGVKVIIECPDEAAALRIMKVSGEGDYILHYKNLVKAEIPIGRLRSIAESLNVNYVRLPTAPWKDAITPQVVADTGTATFHQDGFRGQGTKVAIIDTGFGYLEEAKASGDLPTDMVEVDLTGEGMDYPGWPPHGNAVAQMMHDMAPDAGLYLFNVGDVVDLGVAKDMCISYGINIINHSVSWFNENFYDGTGLVNDIANDARAHGILWVNAAGNFTCLHHWHGKATDPDGNGWINFPREEFQPLFFNSPDIATYYSLFDDGDDETLDICAEFAAFLGGTPTLDLALTWDDWPLSSNDYDMYLYDEDMNLVSESTNLQTGTQPPREHIVYSGPYSKIHPTPYYFDYAIFRLKIKRRADNKENMLMLFNGGDSSYMIPFRTDSSILSPADAESVMAVGAYYRREERLFNYSSHGPTIDGRLKPALVADADIPFYLNGQREIMGGTSSSSPIVAGAAAVILSRHPEYNADMIEGYLLSEAWDEYYRCNGACSVPRLGEPESDNEFGSGVMNLTHCSGFSIGYPQPPQYPVYYFIPRVDLVLDRKLLRKDDILKVKYGIVFDASLTRRPFDIYLGVRLPDGKIMSFDSNLNLSTKIAPTVRNVPLASNYFGKVANFSMQNVSPGKYVLLAACTFAGGFPGGSVFEVYDSACRQDMVCEYLTEESITVLP